MKKLAILGAGQLGKILAIRAKEIGNIETHCFAWEKGAVAKDYADYFYPISIVEKEKLLKKCQEIGIDAIFPTVTPALISASYVSERMNLLGNPMISSMALTDKTFCRELVSKSNGIRNPKFFSCDSIGDLNNCEFEYPLIVKPISTGGKKGVTMVSNYDELSSAISEAKKFAKRDKGNIIVEEYIGGKEYSVESLSYKGKNYIIQITEKENSGPPLHVELAHHQPANLPKSIWDKIEKAVDSALTSVGIVVGPCHTEVKVWNEEVYLIEINGRPGGDHIAYPLTELSSGYPYLTGILKAAIDELEDIDLSAYEKKYAGVYFVVKQSGHLLDIFNKCEQFNWCYKKNKVTEELVDYTHNDCFNTNYFIYCDSNKRPIDIEGNIND